MCSVNNKGQENQMDLPILIESGEHKPWAKEPENAWVLRCLEINPSDNGLWLLVNLNNNGDSGNVELRSTNGANTRKFSIPPSRIIAIESWLKQLPDDHDNGVVLVVIGPQGALMQRKDDKHPTEACRLRYSLFGGSCGQGETPTIGMMREIYEEIRDVELADELIQKMMACNSITLDSIQWEGTYKTAWFIVKTDNQSAFTRWQNSITGKPGLGESDPAFLQRDQLPNLISEEIENIGKHFVASHHVLLALSLCF